MNVNNLTDHHRVYPSVDSHHQEKQDTYVNIRAVARKNRNKTIDIGVYHSNGVRMKVKHASFSEGRVRNGYYTPEETSTINDRIYEIWKKVKEYLHQNPNATKQIIEDVTYGGHFLSTHKKARTKELHLPIYNALKPSAYFSELRRKYPKRKETVITSVINEEGFEEDHYDEVVIDPLSLDSPDFPNNFPKDLKKHLIKKYDLKESNDFFTNQRIKLICSSLFFENQTLKEIVKIEPELLEQFKKQERVRSVTPYSYNITINGKKEQGGHKDKLIALKQAVDFTNTDTETIYSTQAFDKNNLLHIFGSVYFDTLRNQQNERVIIRLFDYVANSNVSTHVSHYNQQWATNFIHWINKHGYIDISAKQFDPLKYNKEIFIGKERQQYRSAGVKKQLVSMKVVGKHLQDKGLLPPVNYDAIKINLFRESVEEGTRNTHYLLLSEFDDLFNYEFKSAKLKQYVSLFDELRSQEVLKGTFANDVSLSTLKLYRDIFCFQIMIGGLRGLPEFQTIELIDYDKTGKVFRFFQEKTQKSKETKRHVLNPTNRYTEILLKRYGNKLPSAKSAEVLNGYLKVIAHSIGLHREVEKGMSVANTISQYWARKTFGNILFSEGISEDQIALFTGHETRKSELGKSYLDLQNVS
ncbi:MAG TPA: hypothetical protein VK658_20215, partial [Chryseolinea sp.]|nr:hypothetical protein [Chryseolinea sp.]